MTTSPAITDQSSDPQCPRKPESVVCPRPVLGKKTSHLSERLELPLPEPRWNADPLPKPQNVPQNNLAPPHLSDIPRSVTPVTPTKNLRNRHPESLSAQAAPYHPDPPLGAPIAPQSFQSNRGGSVGIGSRYPEANFASMMPITPLRQYPLSHSRQTSMGTPSTPVESGAFTPPGLSSPCFNGPCYPEPHQHTPERQAQVFGTRELLPSQIPAAYSPPSFGPSMPPLFRPKHSFRNARIRQNAEVYEQIEPNVEYSQPNNFESFPTPQATNATPNGADLHQNGSMYAQDTNGYGPRFYSNHTDPAHQLNHNLYTPLEPHREPSKSNQKTGRDLFIPEDIRLKLQKRAEATLRTFAVTNTPVVDHYHTLIPLTAVNHQQGQTWRGYSSTTYKAMSSRDGRMYCLRRIHGFQATRFHENAFQTVREKWTTVVNANVVSLHSAFTTTVFDDSSLIVVSDYHPDSRTVAEKSLGQMSGRSNRNAPPAISEKILWSYIVQITNAVKAVHSAQLAVRIFETNKILVTDENRIRLNGCAVEDLLDGEAHALADLQRLDFLKFGNFILAVGTAHMPSSSTRARQLDFFTQIYYKANPQLRVVVEWLLGHDRPENNDGIDGLVKLVSSTAIDAFDHSLHLNDQLYFSLNREIENSRVVRLMTKLSCLTERPEYEHDRTYSAQGTRAVLSLFRDYVFHQVNAQANPVVDMGHILSCLNKLDVGIEEKITLTARDEQSVIVVSYKELKGALESAWQELMRRAGG